MIPTMTNTPVAEPDLAAIARHPKRWLLATRPAFFTLTLGGVLMGVAASGMAAWQQAWPLALLALFLALLCHAAVNVINDVADHDNGSDAANVGRIYPFTGGSRFIQQGVLAREQMAVLAYVLFGIVAVGGLYLVSLRGVVLLVIGMAGVLLGWAYSARPLRLNSRGLGELTVAVCFTLIPLGMAVLLQAVLTPLLWALALSYGLLAAALLYINQFPDREADAQAGKRHWVVRLPPVWARRVYPLLTGAGWLVALLAISRWGNGSQAMLIGTILPLYAIASVNLWENRLRNAIILTIMAANIYPLLLAVVLWH